MGKGTGEKEVEDMILQMGGQHNGRINYLTFVKFWRQFVLQLSVTPKQQLQQAVKKTVTMLRAVRSLHGDHHNHHPPDNNPSSLSQSHMTSFNSDESYIRNSLRSEEDVVVDDKDSQILPDTSVSLVSEKQVMQTGTDTQPIKLRRVLTLNVDGE